jgi:hypothetical protein
MDETLLVGHTVHIWTESYHWGILYMTESYEKDILSMDTTLLVGHTVGYLQEQNPIGMVRHTCLDLSHWLQSLKIPSVFEEESQVPHAPPISLESIYR